MVLFFLISLNCYGLLISGSIKIKLAPDMLKVFDFPAR